MSTQFEFNVPDEPFKTTYELGKTHTVTYTEARYIVVGILPDTKIIDYTETTHDNVEDINLGDYVSDKHTFHIIDAYDHLLEACILTQQYSHEPIDDYTEDLPNGDVYEYSYGSKIFSNIYNSNELTYDHTTQTFGTLEKVTPVTNNKTFWETLDNRISEIEKDSDIGVHDGANQPLNEYLEALKNLKIEFSEVSSNGRRKVKNIT